MAKGGNRNPTAARVGQNTAGAFARLRNRAGGLNTILARARGNNARRARRARPGAAVR